MKPITYFLTLLIVCFPNFTSIAFSQKVVVSEYFNYPGATAQLEWTEILVLEDNISLVGWSVHDYSGDLSARVNGPVFKDIPLWKHLRADTIIVIDHRLTTPAQPTDSDPSDGYIQVMQLDADFFQSAGFGLDIGQPAEMVTIRDADDNPVHSLAHLTSGLASSNLIWLNMPQPKVAHNTASQLQTAYSVRVTGRSVQAYQSGFGSDSTSSGPVVIVAPPSDPGTGPSKGLPNLIDNDKRIAGRKNVNHWFWRETREPTWSAPPSVTASEVLAAKHTISWTSLVDPYPSDSTTGYVILRDTAHFSSFPVNGIRDGADISAGDVIGTAKVLAVRPTGSGTNFVDTDVECGKTYTYRVYGYRFAPDQQMALSQTADTTARGRQYTENSYAQSAPITKPYIPTPRIFASKDAICPGDTVRLWTDFAGSAELYEWTRNGVPVSIPGTTSIVANSTGTYKLRVVGAGGCSAVSNSVMINPLPNPSVVIAPFGTRSLCSGDTLTLSIITAADTYEIIKDGNVIATQKLTKFAITQPGRYAVRIKTPSGCDGVSEELTVSVPDIRYHFEPTALDVGSLRACENSKTGSFTIINDGGKPITFTNIAMPAGFALVSPDVGFVIQPGNKQEVTVRFSPSGNGTISGDAMFTADPCGVRLGIRLTGSKTEALASLDKAEVNFGVYSTCPTSSVRDSSVFVLTNSGSEDITVTPPIVSPPFYINFSTTSLSPLQSVSVWVKYIPLGPDLNRPVNQTMAFPYKAGGCRDTIKATLRAASFQPGLSISKDTLNLGTVIGCSHRFVGTIQVTNTSNVESTISSNSKNSPITILELPVTVPPGQTRTVNFEYVQNSAGTVVTADTIWSEPCHIPYPIAIQSTITKGQFLLNDTDIKIDTVVLCAPTKSSTWQTAFSVAPTSYEDTVAFVSITSPFSTNIRPGTVISTGLPFEVQFAPSVPGAYTDTITVVLQRCSDTLRFPVSAVAVTSSRTTVISDSDFGILPPAGQSSRTVVIRNTGGTGITISPLQGIAPPWSITTTTPTLPTLLAPRDSIIIELTYSYLGDSRTDTIHILSATTGECPDTVLLTLTGRTLPPSAPDTLRGLTLTLPGNISARPGDIVTIPVGLESVLPITGKGLKRFVATIVYNPTLFMPQSCSPSTAAVSSASITELAVGRAELIVESNTELDTTAQLLAITGKVFLGNQTSTPLDIDSVYADNAEITGTDGLLTVVSDCDITSQTVEIGKGAFINVTPFPVVTGSGITVDFQTVAHAPTSLSITDIEGRSWYVGTMNLQPGKHQINISTAEWPAGWYIAICTHGIATTSLPFLISR